MIDWQFWGGKKKEMDDQKLSVVSLVVIHVAVLLFSSVLGAHLEDEIRSLPSQPSDSKANFKQFGGYVTIDEKQGRALFYYFVEAQTQPTSKPLVLWLNGGNFFLFLVRWMNDLNLSWK